MVAGRIEDEGFKLLEFKRIRWLESVVSANLGGTLPGTVAEEGVRSKTADVGLSVGIAIIYVVIFNRCLRALYHFYL